MLLVKENDKYVFECDYHEKDIPKIAGFKWNNLDKVWETSDSSVAKLLINFADDSIIEELENVVSLQIPRIEYNEAEDYFFFVGSFDDKDIAKNAGFRWNSAKKEWWTNDTSIAEILYNYIDPTDEKTKSVLDSRIDNRNETLNQSRAEASDFEAPVPDGLEYLPFQKAGIEYSLNRDNILIGDEMGLGKTIQALGIVNVHNPNSVLVVCPASLKINWKNEAEKWLVNPMDVQIASSKNPFPTGNFVIINYEILKKFWEEINYLHWDVLIVDECHYIKNWKAQRTKMVTKIPSRKKVFLSGTPSVNRPVELWNVCHLFDPEKFKSFTYYAKRYCAAYHNGYGMDYSGASNLGELQRILREKFMIRRLKKDVLTELPAKVRQVIDIPINGQFEDIIANERAVQEYFEEIKREIARLESEGSEEEYDERIKQLKSEMSLAFSEMARVRHDTAVAKIPVVCEYIKNAIESSGKVVAFAHHRDVIEGIKEEFGDQAVILYGGMSAEKKEESITKFQNDENIKLFIGSIQAAGVGITLTESSHVVFAELDWVPGNLSQAEDRCHRIGQNNSVLVQHLVIDNSIDSFMAKKIVEKQKVLDKLLNDETSIARVEAVVANEEPNIEDAVERVERRANTNNNIQEVIERVEQEYVLTENELNSILSAIKIVAGNCDGAHSLDGYGFNRVDTNFGKSLAEQDSLTQRQAKAGLKMVWKYGGQIPTNVFDELASILPKIN